MTQIEIGEILSLVGFFTLLSWILSPQFRELLNQWLNQWRSDIGNLFDPYFYLDIPEFKSDKSNNKVFTDVKLYWTKRNASEISAQKLTVVSSNNSFEFSLASGETVVESFRGATVWSSYHIQNKNDLEEKRWFTLKVAKPSKSILSEYLAHIVKPDSSQLQVLRIGWFINLSSTKPFVNRDSPWGHMVEVCSRSSINIWCWFVVLLPHASVPFVMCGKRIG